MFSLLRWSWLRCVADTHRGLTVDPLFTPTQAFTSEVPFHPYLTAGAMLAILEAKRPARPTHPNLTDELWALMKRCWNQDPYLRPEMSWVLQILRGSSVSLSSRRLDTHLPDLCEATPLPMNPLQKTGPRSLPIYKRCWGPRTQGRTNTLSLPNSFHRVRTRSRAQAQRYPPQLAKAEARSHPIALKQRRAIPHRAKPILASAINRGASRTGALVGVDHAGEHPNLNRRRHYPSILLSLTPASSVIQFIVTPVGLASLVPTSLPVRAIRPPKGAFNPFTQAYTGITKGRKSRGKRRVSDQTYSPASLSMFPIACRSPCSRTKFPEGSRDMVPSQECVLYSKLHLRIN
jgi:hypothetical protein